MANNNAQYVFAFALASLLLLATPVHATRVTIAAVVGDDIITTTDVAERRDLIMATANIPDTIENQQKITPRIVQSLVDETLELQEAKRQSLTVTDDEVHKAIDQMNTTHAADKGDLKEFIASHGLSMRSLENQMRAQLAWSKVVQRKLRRNVSISQDEVARAQKSAAAAPGEDQLRLSSLLVAASTPDKEADAKKTAEELALQLKAGTDMATLAARNLNQPQIQFTPPTWVAESTLQPAMQQAMRSMTEGAITPPFRSSKGYQLIQLLERKTIPKQADTTEYAIKQIIIPAPVKNDKATLARFHAEAAAIRNNPGDCLSENLPANSIGATAKFVRTRLGAMSQEQRALVSNLEVGDVSEPLLSPSAVRLVIVCEKTEPAAGNLLDAETVRKQLFNEKLELEAQKSLRNLRRDAYIDIKGDK